MALVLYSSLNPNDVIGEVTLADLESWFRGKQNQIKMDDNTEEFELSYLEFRKMLRSCMTSSSCGMPFDGQIRAIRVINSDTQNLFIVIQGNNRLWQFQENNGIQNVSQKLLQLRDWDKINFIFINKLPPPPPSLNMGNHGEHGVWFPMDGSRFPPETEMSPMDEVNEIGDVLNPNMRYPIIDRLRYRAQNRPLSDNSLFFNNPNFPNSDTGIETFTDTLPSGQKRVITSNGTCPMNVDNLNIYVQDKKDIDWSFWLIIIIIIIIVGYYYKKSNS